MPVHADGSSSSAKLDPGAEKVAQALTDQIIGSIK
jgi:hypothetical protein